jgi:hypothetical protein
MAVRGTFFYLWSQHRIFRQLISSTDERRVRLALGDRGRRPLDRPGIELARGPRAGESIRRLWRSAPIRRRLGDSQRLRDC